MAPETSDTVYLQEPRESAAKELPLAQISHAKHSLFY